ncbi:MAG: PilT/PilU family type 4a pilus ATPase [Acidobacteriota bacterium]|nr:PilT/PilU family type 4a pilus ATPase [Blastocatellia bacterium]MDW8411820.1 PilT/PilU family type 4a pilus ATPase [Acidobacteriota bacterium]
MNKKELDELLKIAVEDGISDVIFAAGEPPLLRYSGKLMNARSQPLEPQQTELLARIILRERGMETELDRMDAELDRFREVSYELPGIGRFRVSIFRSCGALRLVLRVIPLEVRSFAELNLPLELEQIASLSRGLVLVTGATGQGKSTTVSAILEHINKTRKVHIITIEDPIEYTYGKRSALITQREIGEDVPDYRTAIRQALRQSPDVIMIGEARDKETFEAALSASETGHLVITTLHTTDTINTISRILSMYPQDERTELRQRLALNLAGIISLRLLPRKDSSARIPAVELLRNTPAIAECLRRQDRLQDLYQHMQRGRDYYGMRTFDQHLLELYKAAKIDLETALAAASKPTELERTIALKEE